jgi:hypothetical protein
MVTPEEATDVSTPELSVTLNLMDQDPAALSSPVDTGVVEGLHTMELIKTL